MIINKKRFIRILTNGYKQKQMRVDRGLIGGLIGVHVSSIVKLGYEDNFKPVYFFYEKISRAQKALKRKTSNFHSLRSFMSLKNCCLCCLVFV